MAFKDRMKEKRLEHRLTLDDVARHVGTTRQTIQKYESGVITNIPSDKIELLAEALHTTPAYLMGWDDVAQSNALEEAVRKLGGIRPDGTVNWNRINALVAFLEASKDINE